MSQIPGDSIPTRWSLISRLKKADNQDDWKEFFDTYRRLIYNVALKSGLMHDEAQEVVQETLLVVFKKVPQLKTTSEMGSFKGWLLQITRWRIADQFRKRKRPDNPHERQRMCEDSQTDATPTVEHLPDPAETVLQAMWNREWGEAMFQAAADRVKRQVKPEYYQVFDLAVVRQWPLARVAGTLKLNLGQVYLVKHRVSALMKKELARIQSRQL